MLQWQTVAALAVAVREREGDFVFVPCVTLQNQRQKFYSKLRHLHHDFRSRLFPKSYLVAIFKGQYHEPFIWYFIHDLSFNTNDDLIAF